MGALQLSLGQQLRFHMHSETLHPFAQHGCTITFFTPRRARVKLRRLTGFPRASAPEIMKACAAQVIPLPAHPPLHSAPPALADGQGCNAIATPSEKGKAMRIRTTRPPLSAPPFLWRPSLRYSSQCHSVSWPVFRLLSHFSLKPFHPPLVHRLAPAMRGRLSRQQEASVPPEGPPNFPV